MRKINKSYNSLSQILMREPKIAEVAVEVGLAEEEVASILSMSNSVVSLNGENGDDSGTLEEVYEDHSYDPDRALMQKSLREDTMKFLRSLDQRFRDHGTRRGAGGHAGIDHRAHGLGVPRSPGERDGRLRHR